MLQNNNLPSIYKKAIDHEPKNVDGSPKALDKTVEWMWRSTQPRVFSPSSAFAFG
ncbi:hypothetical protein [Mucilaginibacter agri]|uniref:Uncharacterized protein n=1 Tax=Mucilaginibacter agri TaxID=2695265 RepID=A0A965ZIL6_9SPHI|nr:hypothetical protein [Mucilaginibacter agri]NCD70813.1 hypothetical protein [Mucilaginibacter agri]